MNAGKLGFQSPLYVQLYLSEGDGPQLQPQKVKPGVKRSVAIYGNTAAWLRLCSPIGKLLVPQFPSVSQFSYECIM